MTLLLVKELDAYGSQEEINNNNIVAFFGHACHKNIHFVLCSLLVFLSPSSPSPCSSILRSLGRKYLGMKSP